MTPEDTTRADFEKYATSEDRKLTLDCTLTKSQHYITWQAATAAQEARINKLEAELAEQCRVNGMGAERELQKDTRIKELESELKIQDEANDILTSSCENHIKQISILEKQVGVLRKAINKHSEKETCQTFILRNAMEEADRIAKGE